MAVCAPAAWAWQPEPATYGVGSQTNVAVTASDGTVLRANVYYPTDPGTGQEASGSFPVILTQTPYGDGCRRRPRARQGDVPDHLGQRPVPGQGVRRRLPRPRVLELLPRPDRGPEPAAARRGTQRRHVHPAHPARARPRGLRRHAARERRDGGDQAYDQSYWGARNPVGQIDKIVQDGIPAFFIGGWYDLFQRGELLNYSSFQNAYDHRPLLAPMSPSQPVTPGYQLLQGPWYHVTAGMGLNYHGLDLDGLELAWFDHWLKGIDTGITDTATPLHLEDLATGAYDDVSRYPLGEATPTTYYLQPGGTLSSSAPPRASATDPLVFTGTQIHAPARRSIGRPDSERSRSPTSGPRIRV